MRRWESSRPTRKSNIDRGALHLRQPRVVHPGQLEDEQQAVARLRPENHPSGTENTTRNCRRRTSSWKNGRPRPRRSCIGPAAPVGDSPCPSASRVAINPTTGASLGANTAVAIGTIVPGSGNVLNGIIAAGDGIAKENYQWPDVGFAPRVRRGLRSDGQSAHRRSRRLRRVLRSIEREHGLQPGGQPAVGQIDHAPQRQSANTRAERPGDPDAVGDDRLLLRLEAADVGAMERRRADGAALVVLAGRARTWARTPTTSLGRIPT